MVWTGGKMGNYDWRKNVQPLDVVKARREWEKLKAWDPAPYGMPWPPDRPKKMGKVLKLTAAQIAELLETGAVTVPLNHWETITVEEE